MDNNENKEIIEEKEMKVSSANKRAKKAERRNAKAARKAANKVEEKRSRPNNLVLGIMIFGILILMFGFVKGYEYFSKDASIEAYLEENADSYTEMAFDEYTVANLTAEGNSMTLTLDSEIDGDIADELKEYYGTEDGEDYLKYMGAYFLTSIKPNVRGFSGDVTVVANMNGEEIKTVSMTYKEAQDYLEELEEESEDASEDADDTESTEEADD